MTNPLLDEQKKVHDALAQLRGQLKDITAKKEFWFEKKEALKKEIKDHVQQFRNYKETADKRRIELKELKVQRDKENADVKGLIGTIKHLNKQKYKAIKKYNIKIDPTRLLDRINDLEKKVEIETNFNHEKKLMEEIKKLKKAYEESSEVVALAEQAKQIDTQIKATRKKADEFHTRICALTKDTDYTLFMHLSQQITELKKTQEEAFQIFIEHKNLYLKVTNDLNEQLKVLDTINDQLHKDREYIKGIHDSRRKELAKERSQQVEEKIKSKKRLTTEDILAFQGTEI